MLLLLIFSIFLSSVESFHSSTFVSSNTSSREDATSSSSLPHIILVIIDDYGWANFEAHRTPADDPTHEVQTPVQLELAKEGVLLNRHYGFWYCSPSRSAIQTGRNPIHVNMNNDDLNIFNLNDPISGYAGIPVNMTTIAWKMREANYSTAFYGKHHLGLATPAHTPAGRGFEQSQIYFDGANDYWTQIGETCSNGTSVTDLWITGNGTNNKPYGYPAFGLNNSWSCSQSNQPESCVFEDTMFVNRAIQTIESQDPTRPLFMIFAPHNCHAPLQVPKAAMDKFSFIEDPRRQAYAAKAWWVDNAIGEIVAALKSKGFWDQTAFFVTSDNGGPIYDSGEAGANNWPLFGGKTSNHEGGVRLNALVSGGFLPKSRYGSVVEGFTAVEDYYATFCALAGVDPFDKQAEAVGLPPVDSVNLWPLIIGENKTSPHSEIVLGIPTVSSHNSIGDLYLNVQAVIANDGWKLVVGKTYQNVWTSPHYPNKTTHWPNDPMDCSAGCLYNVFDDPTEHNEISKENPAKVAELLARIHYHNTTVFRPNRGIDNGLGCQVQLNKWKGFVGPFLNI